MLQISGYLPLYGPELEVLGYMQEEDGGTCPYFHKVGGLVVCPAKRYGCDWDIPLDAIFRCVFWTRELSGFGVHTGATSTWLN